jgi:ABC-type bacteriocin/lantibiotic exporter with double-glycine peptidase domain
MALDDEELETTEIRIQRTADAKSALSDALDADDHTNAVVAESMGWVATLRAIREENHFTQKWRKVIQGYGQGAA